MQKLQLSKIFENQVKKKIKVKNTLKLLTEFSKKIRISSNACHVAITGSSGKTSLKELIGQSLNNCYSTVFSKYSYNNKFGVPISLTDLNLNTNFLLQSNLAY